MQASCQCGSLTAAIEDGAEAVTVLCHCLDCQRRSGSPFGEIAYYPKQAVSISGQAREFTRASYAGTHLTNGFCPSCGSTIYVLLEKNPALLGVPVGAFADPGFSPPIRAVWNQHRHGWVSLPEAVEMFARGTDGR